MHKRRISKHKSKRRKSRRNNSLQLRNSKLKVTHLDILTMYSRHLDLNHLFFMSFQKKLELNCLQA